MSTPPPGPKRLPDRPSEENLKKQAKRRAKREAVPLSTAQHRLAREYGFASWPKLMEHVRSLHAPWPQPAEVAAALNAAIKADAHQIMSFLAHGVSPDLRDPQGNPLLSIVCKSPAPAVDRIAAAKALADAKAQMTAFGEDGTTPLHWAAWYGPVALVELLIRAGGIIWQGNGRGKQAIDYAREGVAPDKPQLVELLDRPVIRDPLFKKAVTAIQTGDLPTLRQLLASHPHLVRDRATEPDCYPADYFRDPKLLWFVANNPDLIPKMPANMVEIAETIIDASAEASDLQYTLGLVMTSGPARRDGLQRPLIRLLLDRGARISDPWFVGELGHREPDAVLAVLEAGVPLTTPAAAGLGKIDDLARLLPRATDDEKHAALCLAVINQKLDAAKMCLDAGADVNRFSVCHKNSLPIHQATVNDDVPMIKLLLEHGARLDVPDTLWHGTPLGWAIHTKQPGAEAFLRSVEAPKTRIT